MRERIRRHDWASTPLGPIEGWPPALRTAVDLALAQGFPAILCAGPGRTLIYNDAHRRVIGPGHPESLGRDAWHSFGENAQRFARAISHVMAGGTVTLSDTYFPFRRSGEGKAADAWFDVSISPVPDESGQVLAAFLIYVETTARTQAARAQAYRIALSDALRTLDDPEAIQATAARLLAGHLGASRVHYGEVAEDDLHITIARDHAQGVPSLTGKVRMDDFGAALVAALRTGRTLVLPDLSGEPDLTREERAAYAAIPIRALIAIPLVKDGRLTAVVCVHHAEPRRWTEDEVALVRDTLERTRDAAERARAERALRDSEARLRRALDVEMVGVVQWNTQGRIIDANAAFLRMIGYTREEAVGLTWRDLTPPEFHNESRRMLTALVREGRSPAYEKQYYRRDGTRWWGLLALRRISGDEVTAYVLDVTERHDAEENLRESESRFRTLAEGMPILVWRSCDKGEWTWSSPQWQRFTGRSEEESLGQGWKDALHAEDRPAATRAWEEARPNGQLNVDFRVRRAADGAYVWHQARSSPRRDAAGRITEWLGTTTDIQQLKELQQAQDVLVGELQHRTRNLIAVVRSVADRTLRGSHSMTAFERSFHARLDALARVQSLVSRTTDGETAAFDEVLRAELSAHMDDTAAAHVTLEGPPGIRLRSSSIQTLALALHELTTNAVKYGALTQPGARLSVRWHLRTAMAGPGPVPGPDPGSGPSARRAQAGDQLAVEWHESGVDMSRAGTLPRGGGYGRELIERGLPYQLGARSSYELRSDGVLCTILVPVIGSPRPRQKPA